MMGWKLNTTKAIMVYNGYYINYGYNGFFMVIMVYYSNHYPLVNKPLTNGKGMFGLYPIILIPSLAMNIPLIATMVSIVIMVYTLW